MFDAFMFASFVFLVRKFSFSVNSTVIVVDIYVETFGKVEEVNMVGYFLRNCNVFIWKKRFLFYTVLIQKKILHHSQRFINMVIAPTKGRMPLISHPFPRSYKPDSLVITSTLFLLYPLLHKAHQINLNNSSLSQYYFLASPPPPPPRPMKTLFWAISSCT